MSFFPYLIDAGAEWRKDAFLNLYPRRNYLLWRLKHNKWKLMMSSSFPLPRRLIDDQQVAAAHIGCDKCVSCVLTWSLLIALRYVPLHADCCFSTFSSSL